MIVHTADGSVRGTATSQYRSYLGIPFAEPPLERLRWRPPQRVAPWPGVLNATSYRHNCIQKESFSPAQPRSTLSEDCLYLNVFTPPDVAANSSLPVLFWIHGGGFTGGGANESRLNGTWLQAGGYRMVVVTTNYRLNVFGFLGGRALLARDPSEGTGSYGILDQRAALRWTQENIAAFGGDPNRVLLCGESAGAASVYNHLARPASWGLFSRALAESGGYTFVWGQPMLREADNVFNSLLNATGCAPRDIACLEALSADTLLDFTVSHPTLRFEPTVDGVDLLGQLSDLFASGRVAPSVPLLAGATREDLGAGLLPAEVGYLPMTSQRGDRRGGRAQGWAWSLPLQEAGEGEGDPCATWGATEPVPLPACNPAECSRADLRKYSDGLADAIPALDANRLEQVYAAAEVKIPGGNRTKWWWAAQHMGSDYFMVCPARRSARWWDAAHPLMRSYLYLFVHAPDGPSGEYPALAHHASEIPFVFQDVEAEGPGAELFHISERELPLSHAMVTAWRSFAATGAPGSDAPGGDAPEGKGGGGAAPWPPFAERASWMVFGGAGGVAEIRSAVREAQCEIWDEVAHAQAQVRHDCERREAGSWPLKWLLAAAAVTAGSLITLLELCRRAGLHSQRQLGAKRMLDEIERDTEGLEAEPPARHVADTSLPEGEAQPKGEKHKSQEQDDAGSEVELTQKK